MSAITLYRAIKGSVGKVFWVIEAPLASTSRDTYLSYSFDILLIES